MDRLVRVCGLALLLVIDCSPRLARAAGTDGPRDASFVERVAAEHAGDRPVANVTQGAEGVDAEALDYATLDGQPVRGYLARPTGGAGPYPAVIVIHEWWGLNDNIRAITRRLAAAGYIALAVDLYEGRTADDPAQAQRLMQAAMQHPDRLGRNLEQAFYYLDIMPSANRIGVIGWCFGGGWALRTALRFPDELGAAVIYYGELVTDPHRLAPLQVPILGHFGAADGSIPVSRVQAFDQALAQLKKPHEIHIYDGAGHAFANPSGMRYVPAAADLAWNRTMAFLARTLGSTGN